MSTGMVDGLIADYVAGALPEPARVLMASHIEMRSSSASMAHAFEVLAGKTLERTETRLLTNGEGLLDVILRSTPPVLKVVQSENRPSVLPSALRDYIGRDLADIPWKGKLPGLKQHVIEHNKDGTEASLLLARPGRALPNHTHEGLELTLVLDGDFHDHRGTFIRGDVSVADESLDHRPVAGMSGPCLCLSVLFAPIVLSGSKMSLLGDILGI
ncbi:ChrR family anti-sigma-E factor [Neorhizobium sp. NPDC001467]|uniref:ChrR family anti-sigma-E factor n=1 Tax=Neorhizobium sp. NPDC001467 TaxID=3390595 RepID=UPI003D05A3FB